MNDVSVDTEVTSVKTTPTQRRSRVNPVGRVVTLLQQMTRKPRKRIETNRKHGDENETNKAKIETKKGSEK